MERKGGFVKEVQDNFLKCGLCKSEYDRPKTLPCMHSFCEDCLLKHADVSQSTFRFSKFQRPIMCPVCEKRTDITKSDVASLPDNFLLTSLSDILIEKGGDSSGTSCDICSKRPGKSKKRTAIQKCLECDKKLCKHCVATHSSTKVTQDHTLYALEHEETLYCSDHTEETVRYVCETCGPFICVVCAFEKHKGHELVSINELANDSFQTALQESAVACQDRASDIQQHLEKITQWEHGYEEAKRAIDEAAARFLSEVTDQQSSVLRSLDLAYGDDVMAFVKQKGALTSALQKLRAAAQWSEGNSAQMADTSVGNLLLKSELQQNMKRLMGQALPEIPERHPGPVLFKEGVIQLGSIETDKKEEAQPKGVSPVRFIVGQEISEDGVDSENSEMLGNGRASTLTVSSTGNGDGASLNTARMSRESSMAGAETIATAFSTASLFSNCSVSTLTDISVLDVDGSIGIFTPERRSSIGPSLKDGESNTEVIVVSDAAVLTDLPTISTTTIGTMPIERPTATGACQTEQLVPTTIDAAAQLDPIEVKQLLALSDFGVQTNEGGMQRGDAVCQAVPESIDHEVQTPVVSLTSKGSGTNPVESSSSETQTARSALQFPASNNYSQTPVCGTESVSSNTDPASSQSTSSQTASGDVGNKSKKSKATNTLKVSKVDKMCGVVIRQQEKSSQSALEKTGTDIGTQAGAKVQTTESSTSACVDSISKSVGSETALKVQTVGASSNTDAIQRKTASTQFHPVATKDMASDATVPSANSGTGDGCVGTSTVLTNTISTSVQDIGVDVKPTTQDAASNSVLTSTAEKATGEGCVSTEAVGTNTSTNDMANVSIQVYPPTNDVSTNKATQMTDQCVGDSHSSASSAFPKKLVRSTADSAVSAKPQTRNVGTMQVPRMQDVGTGNSYAKTRTVATYAEISKKVPRKTVGVNTTGPGYAAEKVASLKKVAQKSVGTGMAKAITHNIFTSTPSKSYFTRGTSTPGTLPSGMYQPFTDEPLRVETKVKAVSTDLHGSEAAFMFRLFSKHRHLLDKCSQTTALFPSPSEVALVARAKAVVNSATTMYSNANTESRGTNPTGSIGVHGRGLPPKDKETSTESLHVHARPKHPEERVDKKITECITKLREVTRKLQHSPSMPETRSGSSIGIDTGSDAAGSNPRAVLVRSKTSALTKSDSSPISKSGPDSPGLESSVCNPDKSATTSRPPLPTHQSAFQRGYRVGQKKSESSSTDSLASELFPLKAGDAHRTLMPPMFLPFAVPPSSAGVEKTATAGISAGLNQISPLYSSPPGPQSNSSSCPDSPSYRGGPGGKPRKARSAIPVASTLLGASSSATDASFPSLVSFPGTSSSSLATSSHPVTSAESSVTTSQTSLAHAGKLSASRGKMTSGETSIPAPTSPSLLTRPRTPSPKSFMSRMYESVQRMSGGGGKQKVQAQPVLGKSSKKLPSTNVGNLSKQSPKGAQSEFSAPKFIMKTYAPSSSLLKNSVGDESAEAGSTTKVPPPVPRKPSEL